MGWTFMPSRGRKPVAIICEQLDYDNDTYTQKVIDQAAVGTTVYLLVERTPKDAWEPDGTYVNDPDGAFRWIAVFLTRRHRDAYDFGYKDMSEGMGPVESNCPKRLIAAASQLRADDASNEDNYAARWRKRCLDNLAKKKLKFEHGAVVRLSRPIKFTDGYEGDLFTVCIVRSRGRNRTCFKAPNDGRLYRITNLDAIGFRIETNHAAAAAPAEGGQ